MGQVISVWEFSCKLYSGSDAQDACHYLQDEWHVDIPLFLFNIWAGSYYVTLSDKQSQNVLRTANVWHKQCIVPLRRIRQTMKITQSEDIQRHSWEQVREQVKSLELQTEKQLLTALEKGAECYTLHHAPSLLSAGEEVFSARMENLQQCFPSLFEKLNISTSCDNSSRVITAIATIMYAAPQQMEYYALPELIDKIRTLSGMCEK